MKLYLAGPMSGLPDFNYPAFNAEADRLRSLGYHVENPAENPDQDDWQGYMRVAIPQMLACDAVALLPDWYKSVGADLEHYVATSIGMPCRPAHCFADEQAPA